MTSMSEPALVAVAADPSPTAEAPESSPAAEALGPSSTVEVAGTSLAVGAVTVEEVMELATSRYIDFPDVRVIDLEAPNSRRRCWTWRRSGCSLSRRSWR
jgi:hypothetical protein